MGPGLPPRGARPRRHERPVRRLALVATIVALAIGLLPVHAGPGAHTGMGGPTRVLLTVAHAPQHGASQRLEAGSGALELPQCAACVLQLQSRAAQLAAAGEPAALVDLGLAAPPPTSGSALAAPWQACSRGPPRA